jgi:KDO2-lipid IV(A) lauroyltransferase
MPLWAYRLGWRLVRAMPERVAYLSFSLIAQFVWLRQGRGVRQLESNLARVEPGASAFTLKSLSRKGMHSYMRYWCDVFRIQDWSRERILETCRAEGDGPARAYLASGRGVVMALTHQGNWDHAGAWSALALAKVTTVAERLEPQELFERFQEFRAELGMEVLPSPSSGDGEVFGYLSRRLHAGGFVPLLADRDLTANGVPVQLFGEAARLAAGPAALALATEAALFPVTIHYERLPAGAPARWGTVVRFHDEVVPPETGSRSEKVVAMTQAYADALEEGIRQHPRDWHMLQRVFLVDLTPELGPPPAPGSRSTRHR